MSRFAHLSIAFSSLALAFAWASPASALTAGVTTLSGLGATDSYSWEQLGPNGTSAGSPKTVTSANLASANASSAGGALQRIDQGGGWNGNFAPGTALLWNGGIGPDITFDFSTPVTGGGAQIQADFFGSFTAEISAFDLASALIGTFLENGNSSADADGSAIFIGIKNDSANIARLQFSLTSASAQPNSFSIGPLSVSGAPLVSAVPVPAALPLFLAALGALGVLARRRKFSAGV